MLVTQRPYISTVASLLREQLRVGSVEIRATGTSMFPLIPPGAAITLESIEAQKIELGDILYLESPEGKFLIHRFHGCVSNGKGLPCGVNGQERLITKGDWRLHFDRPWPSGSVVGRVAKVERPGWRRWDRLYVVLVVQPLEFLTHKLGARPVEKLYSALVTLARLSFYGRRLWSRRKYDIRLLRADQKSELVAELCQIDSTDIVATIQEPSRWLCLALSVEEQVAACILCHLDRGHWSVEAVGFRDRVLGDALMEELLFRLLGFRTGRAFALRDKTVKEAWSPMEFEWLLSHGFVELEDGVLCVSG